MSSAPDTGHAGVRRQAERLRDGAVVASAAIAAVIQGLAENWFALGVAVVAAALWVGIRRGLARTARARRTAPHLLQASFLALGLLLVWRLAFAWLPLAVAGMWLLVSAAEFDRFVERFPAGAAARVQRAALRRKLQLLGVVAAVSAVTVLAARVLTLQLRIVAVMLLAGFVTIVAFRVARDVTRVTDADENEPE
ncbi:MAG: hypothetical protein ACOC1U_08755 [Spirochaetota bacterium]